jgi:hypothetical protein
MLSSSSRGAQGERESAFYRHLRHVASPDGVHSPLHMYKPRFGHNYRRHDRPATSADQSRHPSARTVTTRPIRRSQAPPLADRLGATSERGYLLDWFAMFEKTLHPRPKRLTENELSDFRRLWHDGCGKTIIEAQDVDRNHSPEV